MNMRLWRFVCLILVIGNIYGRHRHGHKVRLSKKHHTNRFGNKILSKVPAVQYIKQPDSFRSVNKEVDVARNEIEDDPHEFQNFGGSDPILWNEGNNEKPLHSLAHKKGDDGEAPASEEEGGEDPFKNLPNTVGPNPNIYGGFPENDVWGNFELPAPDTIDHLKMALKMHHHRPSYAGDQASDAGDQLYGYEHHALPEYDIMETPGFQEVMWQNAQLQQSLKGGAKPSCAPGMGSCPPVNNEKVCENLKLACASNAQHPKDPKLEYAPPCASNILELFGCGKPPPEKTKEEKPKEEKEKPKPKPIPKEKEKEKEKEEKPPPKKKPDLGPVGEQLTSEDSGSKLISSNDVSSLTQILNQAHENKLSADTIASTQARQSFHSYSKQPAQVSAVSSGKVGLMNEEESLALMTAIGNDLQKSLSEKFAANSKFEKEQQEDDSDLLKSNNEQATDSNHVTHDDTSSLVNKKINSKGDDKGELTSYFQTLNGVKESSEARGGERVFSDWSSWSKCMSPCGDKRERIRRRNCLKEICNGLLIERMSCAKKRCSINKILSSKQMPSLNQGDTLKGLYHTVSKGLTLPDKQLAETIQPNDATEYDHSIEDIPSDTFHNVVSRFQNRLMTNNEVEHKKDNDQESTEASTIANLLEKKLHSSINSEDTTLPKLKTENTNNPIAETKTENSNNPVTETKTETANNPVAEGKTESVKNPTNETKTAPNLEIKHIEPTWGEWGLCSKTCGIGHVTRMLKCDDDCGGWTENFQTRPCRKEACEDPETERLFKEDCLSLHNELRRRHGAEPLEWSDELYRKAVEISDRVAMQNIPVQNVSKYERPGLNLGVVSLSNVQNNKTETTACSRAIENWYGQKLNYNYDTPQLTTEDRDFTQLVWKTTKRVGISKSISVDGTLAYIAAVYEPAGNVDSYYDMKKNALPIQDASNEQIMEFLDKLLVNKKHKKSLIANP